VQCRHKCGVLTQRYARGLSWNDQLRFCTRRLPPAAPCFCTRPARAHSPAAFLPAAQLLSHSPPLCSHPPCGCFRTHPPPGRHGGFRARPRTADLNGAARRAIAICDPLTPPTNRRHCNADALAQPARRDARRRR
jgi:hypothetical protein